MIVYVFLSIMAIVKVNLFQKCYGIMATVIVHVFHKCLQLLSIIETVIVHLVLRAISLCPFNTTVMAQKGYQLMYHYDNSDSPCTSDKKALQLLPDYGNSNCLCTSESLYVSVHYNNRDSPFTPEGFSVTVQLWQQR